MDDGSIAMVTVSNDNKITIPIHRTSSTEKIFFFLSGIITSAPLTLFVEQFSDSLVSRMPEFYALLFSAVIFAPFIEEFAKAFPLLYRHGETQRSIFTLGFLVGLGFGAVEFFIYVFLLGVPFIFRLPGIFFHAATTSIIAYGVATKRTVWFYLIAVFLHVSINFSAFLRETVDPYEIGPSFVLAYVIAASTFLLSWRLYLKTSERTF